MKNNLQLVVLGFKLTAKGLLIGVPLMVLRNFPKMVPFAAFLFLCLFAAFPTIGAEKLGKLEQ